MCPWSSSRAPSPARRLPLFLCLCLAAALPAAASDSARLLEVSLNGVPTGLIAEFTERGDGTLAMAASELAEIGIALDKRGLAGDGLVDLKRLPGVTYRYDTVHQSIAITAAVSGLVHHTLNARPDDVPVVATSGRGAVLNYALFGSLGDAAQPNVAANLDGRVFFEGGLVSQSLVARAGSDNPGIVRLDTTFSRSDPVTLLTWKAGDFISGGLSWTRPYRLGGVQVARNFSLRPDLVTMPVPGFEGSSAVPSTVEIYANGAQIYSSPVAAGPFSIAALPVVSGAGTARIVVTDAFGRKTATELPFFASSVLLRKGLYDFSAEAGLPRRSFGILSADYTGMPAASASLRYGLTDTITLEAHGEAAGGIVNAGGGVVMPVARLGIFDLAAAASAGSHTGLALHGGIDLAIGRMALRLHATRTFGDYADVASVTAATGSGGDFRPAREIDQASLSLTLFDAGAVALTFTRLVAASTSSVVGLSYSRPLFGDGTVYVNGFASVEGERNLGIFVGFSRPLPGGIDFAATASVADRASAAVDLSKTANSAPGSFGWRLEASSDAGGRNAAVRAAGTYRGKAARLGASFDATTAGVRGTAEADGSLVFAGGEVYAANRIDDAFAIVDAGAPGVEVYSENRPVGRTDRRGKLLVAGLHAYQRNGLAIAPDDLPADSEATLTKTSVVPADRAGVNVDFGVRPMGASAVVILQDVSGAFLPPGATGTLASGGEFAVGYDGQAFLTGLSAANTITVDLGNGATCTAHFAFHAAGLQTSIEGVKCL
ncbi:MAG: fimbria/pilus outer membrane usher protein [Bauldia sp.]